jgi:hypothetical protein
MNLHCQGGAQLYELGALAAVDVATVDHHIGAWHTVVARI